MSSWRDNLTELTVGLRGPSFVAGSPGYDDEVAVFNQAVAHRPALVVGAENDGDVSAAVSFAARHRLDVAVLNTGHGPSLPAGPDTLMITTKRMDTITIDAPNKKAR